MATSVAEGYYASLPESERAATRREFSFNREGSNLDALNTYRARPLDGIAFTAPYGHNGAWPTIRDMLDPPSRRPTRFRIVPGSFDPTKVGVDVSADGPNAFDFDATRPGNWNTGHVYGTWLTSTEKDDLVEFMKTL